MKTKLATCNKCNKVYFIISRKKAQVDVTISNKYYLSCTEEMKKKHFKAGPSKISTYESCMCGNSYKDFRDFKVGDSAPGDMLIPLIDRND